jgi:penicillin V acylase-like amidase (Ntn superfamily)
MKITPDVTQETKRKRIAQMRNHPRYKQAMKQIERDIRIRRDDEARQRKDNPGLVQSISSFIKKKILPSKATNKK